MNAENMNDVEAGRVPPPNAVSIYGQNDAMDDFPVLKAFQQYIDAEQAKAQKRMTTLCIFFAIIMTIVVGVFVALLVNMAQDKNRISDQMIQFMLKERDHGPVVVQPPSGQTDATVKALTESMTNLQKQLADQQMKMVEQQNKFFEQRAQDAARRAKEEVESEMGQPPSKAQVDLAKKNQQDIAKIKKANALLQKQKEELAKEKERLRQKEIELQRRKLYPELYENGGKPAEHKRREQNANKSFHIILPKNFRQYRTIQVYGLRSKIVRQSVQIIGLHTDVWMPIFGQSDGKRFK